MHAEHAAAVVEDAEQERGRARHRRRLAELQRLEHVARVDREALPAEREAHDVAPRPVGGAAVVLGRRELAGARLEQRALLLGRALLAQGHARAIEPLAGLQPVQPVGHDVTSSCASRLAAV